MSSENLYKSPLNSSTQPWFCLVQSSAWLNLRLVHCSMQNICPRKSSGSDARGTLNLLILETTELCNFNPLGLWKPTTSSWVGMLWAYSNDVRSLRVFAQSGKTSGRDVTLAFVRHIDDEASVTWTNNLKWEIVLHMLWC